MAIDAFLDFSKASPPVKGEAQDNKYPNTFHCKWATFGAQQAGTAATGSGLGAGKAQFEPFTFKIDTQSGSAQLMKHCAAGTHFDTVKLYLRKAGGGASGGQTFQTYTFKSVLITEYRTNIDEESTDTVSLVFMSVFSEYYAQKQDGTLDSTPTRGGWDLKGNKEVTSA